MLTTTWCILFAMFASALSSEMRFKHSWLEKACEVEKDRFVLDYGHPLGAVQAR